MAYKILVVDDEPDWETIIRQKFKKQIKNREWEFLFASNGLEALKKIDEIPDIKVVLLDINMPEMDGLSVLRQLNEKGSPIIRTTIVVSAFADMENIRATMNAGAFDFLPKPVDSKDLENTIRKTQKHFDVIKDALEKREKLAVLEKELEIAALKKEHEIAAIKRELEIAAQIQRNMLPRIFPPFPDRREFDIYAKMRPAKEMGGDFYDFFFLDSDRLAFAVGDVEGKDIKTALQMVKTCTLLGTIASIVVHPEECLRRINNLLIPKNKDDINFSVTLLYGVLNTKKGEINYSCAGHPGPYLLCADGKVDTSPAAGGFPLGIFENSDYETKKIKINQGDTIFIYTDGVTDADDPEGNQFNDDGRRLSVYLEGKHKMPLKKLINGLIAEIDQFTAGEPQADDMTLLTLRYNES